MGKRHQIAPRPGGSFGFCFRTIHCTNPPGWRPNRRIEPRERRGPNTRDVRARKFLSDSTLSSKQQSLIKKARKFRSLQSSFRLMFRAYFVTERNSGLGAEKLNLSSCLKVATIYIGARHLNSGLQDIDLPFGSREAVKTVLVSRTVMISASVCCSNRISTEGAPAG